MWYTLQARGKHKIEGVVAKLCDRAGFSGKRTNHSARASAASNLYEQGIDEQLIQEKTGHRSVAVRSYKRTSNRQLKNVSDILYGNINAQSTSSKPSSTLSKPPSDNEDDSVCKKVKTDDKDVSSTSTDVKGLTININVNVSK